MVGTSGGRGALSSLGVRRPTRGRPWGPGAAGMGDGGRMAAPAGVGSGSAPEPVVSEPTVTEPVALKPVAAEPVAAEPVAPAAVVSEAVVSEAGGTEAVVSEAGVSEAGGAGTV